MKRLNILMVTDFFLPSMGGVERVIYELGKELVKRGHPIHILTPGLDNLCEKEEEIERIKIHRFNVNRKNVFAQYFSTIFNGRKMFEKLVRHTRFDLIHFHLTLSSLGILWSKKSKDIVKFFTFYGPWYRETELELGAREYSYFSMRRYLYPLWIKTVSLLMKHLQRYALRKSDRVIVLSDYSRNQVRELVPDLSADDVVLISGGVDVSRFKPTCEIDSVRRKLRVPEKKFVLFTVRRLVPRMGVENLIYATRELLDKNRDVYLIIGGKGPLKDKLANVITRLKLDESVKLVGYIDEGELPLYYQCADLFVLPTVALEGFGLPILEALSCGVPVMGTPVGAIKEVLGSFDKDYLAIGTNPKDLSNSISNLMSAGSVPDLKLKCRRFAENYTWEKIVDRLEEHYFDQVNNNPVHLAIQKGVSSHRRELR